MDISIVQQQATQSIVDYTAVDELDTLRLSAYSDLEDLSHTLGFRTLTDDEMTTFQYSIEVIIRLDSKKYGDGDSVSFREKRRKKLMAYYSNFDRSKGLRKYKI